MTSEIPINLFANYGPLACWFEKIIEHCARNSGMTLSIINGKTSISDNFTVTYDDCKYAVSFRTISSPSFETPFKLGGYLTKQLFRTFKEQKFAKEVYITCYDQEHNVVGDPIITFAAGLRESKLSVLSKWLHDIIVSAKKVHGEVKLRLSPTSPFSCIDVSVTGREFYFGGASGYATSDLKVAEGIIRALYEYFKKHPAQEEVYEECNDSAYRRVLNTTSVLRVIDLNSKHPIMVGDEIVVDTSYLSSD